MTSATTPASTRLPYDDAATPAAMRADATRAGARLRRAAARATRPAPSLHFADQPREVAKPEIQVSEAARHLAASLGLTTG